MSKHVIIAAVRTVFPQFVSKISIFLLVLVFTSCNKQGDTQPVSEKEKIVQLMKDFGFEEVTTTNARSSGNQINTRYILLRKPKLT